MIDSKVDSDLKMLIRLVESKIDILRNSQNKISKDPVLQSYKAQLPKQATK